MLHTHGQARDYCHDNHENGQLAHIQSVDDNARVRFILDGQPGSATGDLKVWIGAHNYVDEDDDVERWSSDEDDSPLVYVNWRAGAGTADNDKDCATLAVDGLWDDQICTRLAPFVCESTGTGVSPPSPFPRPPPTSCEGCDTCASLLRSEGHLFRRMWGADPWLNLRADRASCFTHSRDHSGDFVQPASRFFDLILEGRLCGSNWYEGTEGMFGQPWFPDDTSPALLGFDESIDDFCGEAKRAHGDNFNVPHAESCRRGSLNILSLHGAWVPYNICRNLEWLYCAINGQLPGQGSRTLVFARAPRTLDYDDGNDKVLDDCRGWRPPWYSRDCREDGYATDSIFFLETCLLSELCANNHELWDLDEGDDFECEFTMERFETLKQLLLGIPHANND